VRTDADLRVQNEWERRLRSLFKYALANGLATTDDTFAYSASGGRYTATELADTVRRLQSTGADTELRELVRGLRDPAFRYLVSLQANQPQYPDRELDAAVLLEAMILHGHPRALTRLERGAFLDLLATQRRREDLDRFISDFGSGEVGVPQANLLRANASHPFVTGREDGSSPGVDAWLELVNWLFIRDGLEPIALAPGGEPPFDRVICAPSSLVDDGPLVTVIVPTYNPGTVLATALESLLAQSYRNLEIVLVDDGSDNGAAESLKRWQDRDARIRVVLLPENRGPYHARNAAAARFARGEYLTVHDDDDWSHPRKLELQVAHLEAERDELANMSVAFRTAPNLWIVRRGQAPDLVHENYSSLMIRRSVMQRLGYWDLVNRGADGELRNRLVAVSGRPIPIASRVPMSILRIRQDSLSYAEINKGYFDPRRRWYNLANTLWHRSALAEGRDPYLPADGGDSRPFPAPVDMLRRPAEKIATQVDILYATDYRFRGGNSTLACNEIEILLDRGHTVGMLQLDSPVNGTYTHLHPRAYALASHPNARVVTQKDVVSAPLTIVRHPSVLQFMEPKRLPISSQRVVLIVNHPPINPDRQSACFAMETVAANCEAIFGRVPVVAPESGMIRSLLAGLLDPDLLALQDWNGVVSISAGEPRHTDPSRPPVIGRHSRDHLGKWPTPDVLTVVYPIDGSRDIRVLGGADHARERLGKPVDGVWTVYPFGSKPAAEFLKELDFWVYFHGPDWYESFGMATAEAMAAGLVVILPPVMQPTFGDGAIYCEPSDVGRLIDELWADPAAYTAQSARAVRTAQERFGEAALLVRIEQYLS
jgi:glycosyltransferase involved in cell wall biosynthesis